MGESCQFQYTLARWSLSEQILRAVLRILAKTNGQAAPQERITVTSNLNLLEQFDVYRQPGGAHTATKTRVAWESELVRVECLDGSFSQDFKTQYESGEVRLQEITVDQLADLVFSKTL